MTEAISFLVLLLIAMPLKYGLDQPEAVRCVGWIHGVLFVALCVAIVAAVIQARLPHRLALLAFVASVIPFGPFLIDGALRRAESDAATDGDNTADAPAAEGS